MSERKTAEPPPTAGWFRRGEGSLGLIAPAIDEFEAPEMDLEQNVDCACENDSSEIVAFTTALR